MGLFAYGVTLLLATLLSRLFQRTLLSSTVLFLAAGFFTGHFASGSLAADAPGVRRLSDWALVTVLFTDGLRIGWAISGPTGPCQAARSSSACR